MTLVMAGDVLGQNSSDPWPYPNRLSGPDAATRSTPAMSIPSQAELLRSSGCARLAGAVCNLLGRKWQSDPRHLHEPIGNNGRTSVIGPGLINLDFSVFKNIHEQESRRASTFRSAPSFFNIMNHQLPAPLDNKVRSIQMARR